MPISVLNKGVIADEKIILTSLTPSIVEVEEDRIIGRGVGEGIVRCALSKNETKYKDIKVIVEEGHQEDTEDIYIVGNDYIGWNTSETYMLSNNKNAIFAVEWKSKIKHSQPVFGDNSITISIKDKYSGTVIISAEYEGKLITKEVYIKTL